MYCDVRGTGPALVLIHGWAMHGGLFAPLLAQLESQFTVYRLDLPGHGYSADSALPLQLDAIVARAAQQLPRALWLGWSMGGLVALHAAATRPEQVRGLVMIGATPRFVHGPDWPAGMDPALFRGFASELAKDYRGTLDRFLMLEVHGSDHARDELQGLRERIFAHGEPTVAVLCQGLGLLETTDLRAQLPGLTVPSLWLAGRRDRLVSPEAMRSAAALTPNSRFLQIDGGGHSPFLTHAGPVAEAMRSFVASLPA